MEKNMPIGSPVELMRGSEWQNGWLVHEHTSAGLITAVKTETRKPVSTTFVLISMSVLVKPLSKLQPNPNLTFDPIQHSYQISGEPVPWSVTSIIHSMDPSQSQDR